ncbi:hypothetical protein Hanom_Chr08g00729471 [Helianthus anomalus]
MKQFWSHLCAHVEKVTRVEPEIEVQSSSSEEDSEATQSESELDPTTLGRGKTQLKKKPLKKKKTSDDEDRSYDPDESIRKKRKAVQAGVIPRNVRAKKSRAEPQKDKGGKKENHVQKEKTPIVEIPKEPEVQTKVEPVVEAEKGTGDDDYVEIIGFKPASPRPVPQDIPKSSHQKETGFNFNFNDFDSATGIFTEDIPEGDYDMFNDQAIKELIQKVNKLEKEKAKAELKRDILKKQVDRLMKAHDQE